MPLIREMAPASLSVYLRQHADNPVDWYPWGEEAFERARSQDCPVFLSVGYSSCHWCHVMAHESFENPMTAEELNASFVSIKVDREERPDVDAVYMEAVQALTGSGGWPMSVFLTPDGRPFFGGTYFPPEDRHGMLSFRNVLQVLSGVWAERRGDVEEQADQLAEAIGRRSTVTAAPGSSWLAGRADPALPDLVDAAADEVGRRFDPTWGGFGPAPKFPQPTLVDLVPTASLPRPGGDLEGGGGARFLDMATGTLDAMAAGGIHDHLGGGFARYSTDVRWLVPHFEKMLYDQAGLLRAFLHGWLVTGRANYFAVMEGIVGYVARDLTSAAGGIYSAEDADSEGVEGRFYVWSPEQIDAAIDEADTAHAVAEWFGVTEDGNFEGSSILFRPPGAPLGGGPAVESGRSQLLHARRRRVRPGLDDKVLTEWNAMYASSLAEAAAATGNRDWSEAAVSIGQFLIDHLRDSGRWMRSWTQDGGARYLAYAADYACLVDCFTRLGELTGDARWTEWAVTVADGLLGLFHDDQEGGFFTTGNDAEALIVRTKDVMDGATPSANAMAARALVRLGALTGHDRFTAVAAEVVDLLGDMLENHPSAFAHTVVTADLLSRGMTEVVITGDRPDLLAEVRRRWLPAAVVAWGEPTPSPLWEGRDGDRAYVCRNYACQLPADTVGTLSEQLSEESR